MKKLTKRLLSIFAFVFVFLAGAVIVGCGENKNFDESKINVGETTFTYDGSSHVCEIKYDEKKVSTSVTYSLDANEDREYVAKTKIEIKNPGAYTLFYKLSAKGYNDYVGSVDVKIKGFQLLKSSSLSCYATLSEAISYASSDSVIKMFDNVELSAPLSISKSITIDGQGSYEIKASDIFSGENLIMVKTTDVTATLKNVTVNGNQKGRVAFISTGKLVIDGAVLKNGYIKDYVYGVVVGGDGTLEMNSGSITGHNYSKDNDYSKVYSADVWIDSQASAKISGGVIGKIFLNSNSTATDVQTVMNGGNVESIYVEYDSGYGAKFVYNNGNISRLRVGTTKGNGDFVELVANKGTTYIGGITEYTTAETIMSVESYDELVSAINNANVDIVNLSQDIDVENMLKVKRSLTLNLNGKKLYNTNSLWIDGGETSNCLLDIDGENIDVVLTGNGTIETLTGDCYAINVRKGNITIENGTIKGNVSAVQVVEGTATILGGYFEDQQKWTIDGSTTYRYTLNCIDDNYKAGKAKFVVKGGTFVNFNPENCLAEGENTNFVADGYEAKLVEGSLVDFVVTKKI